MISFNSSTRRFFVYPYLIIAGCIIGFLAQILVMNHGVFCYTLDDAYIHLSLSENIIHGHYGINPGECSSPSSSILWPFLLAPWALTPFHIYMPFVINTVCGFVIIFLIQRILARYFFDDTRRSRWNFFLVTLLFIFLGDVIGLIFNGMEHPLQVLMTILVVYGIILEREEGSLPWWFGVSLALGPLIRYENLSVTLWTCLYLILRGRIKFSFKVMGAVIILLSSFSLFLLSIGQNFLPSSVFVKSDFQSNSNIVTHFISNFLFNLGCFPMAFLLFVNCILVMIKKNNLTILLLALNILILASHLMAGRNPIWGFETIYYTRYVPYCITFTLLSLFYIFQCDVKSFFYSYHPMRILVMSAALILCIFYPFFEVDYVALPLASNNIYEQHYHMHLLTQKYWKENIAVNDIGYISYHNDNYVLDLWGLSLHKAHKMKMMYKKGEIDNAWMNDLVKEYDIKLAILYDNWYRKGIPDTWRLVAKMKLTLAKRVVGGSELSFYAINQEFVYQICEILQRFHKDNAFHADLEIFYF